MITALLVLSVAVVIGFGVALAVRSKREFGEQNQVVPGRPSPAPASWAGAHSREAKLHRRLGDAVKGAHQNPRFVELGLAPQMAQIDTQALAIDERLVAAANLPASHRDTAIDAVEAHVVELEQTIADLVTSVSVTDSRAQLEQAVSAADIRLQALAEARAIVEEADRRGAGLPSPRPADPGAAEPTQTAPGDGEPGTASAPGSS
ncbi:MAG: hypothetical protein AAFP84_09535 [Actinomycetota bacterium]